MYISICNVCKPSASASTVQEWVQSGCVLAPTSEADAFRAVQKYAIPVTAKDTVYNTKKIKEDFHLETEPIWQGFGPEGMYFWSGTHLTIVPHSDIEKYIHEQDEEYLAVQVHKLQHWTTSARTPITADVRVHVAYIKQAELQPGVFYALSPEEQKNLLDWCCAHGLPGFEVDEENEVFFVQDL